MNKKGKVLLVLLTLLLVPVFLCKGFAKKYHFGIISVIEDKIEELKEKRLGSISGKVTESDGTTPIPGALVRALQNGEEKGQATTKSDGTYTISGLEAGTYDVEASATGYVAETKEGIEVVAGEITKDINFALATVRKPADIPWEVASGGGGRRNSANYGVRDSTCQFVVGKLRSNSYKHQVGFVTSSQNR